MNFFKEVIASLLKQSDDGSTHSSFKVCDPTAVGSSPVRELVLDVVSLGDESRNSIVTLAWKDSAEKILEKTTSSEEASHEAQLLATDLAQLVKLTDENKYDEAKEVMKNMLKTYNQDSSTPVATNMPVLNNTQAELDIDANLWKQAAQVKVQNVFPSGTIQNLTFENQEDLNAYMGKQNKAEGNVPLWEQEGKGKSPESKDTLVPSSLSYEDVEKQKEEEHESLKDHMDETIKKELESALQEKAASVFGPEQVELVKVLRKNGRNWDEITKMLTKDFHYDKDATTIFVDQQRQAAGDEGIEIKKEEIDPLRPPKDLVTDETHDKLLEDLKKSKEPVEETKEIEKVDETPIVEESALDEKCPSCGHTKPVKGECPSCKRCDCEQGHVESSKKSICPECDGEGDVPAVRGGRVTVIPCPSCSGDKHIEHVPKELESAIEEISRADNSDIRKVATVIPAPVAKEIKEEIVNSMYRMNAPGAKFYRFSLDGDKIHRGEFNSDEEFGPYQFIYDMEQGIFTENPNYKPTAYASLKRAASYMNISETDSIEKTAADDLNPLQEPIREEPTMETPEQDKVPFGKDPSHRLPKPESWVIVGADLKGEMPAFRGKFVSEETESDGTKWGIVDKDGELLKVEMHRITPETEGAQTADPIATPEIEKPQEAEVPVTPSLDSLHSASSLKEEAATHTKCIKCDKSLPVSDMVSNEHGAGYLCKEHAAEWNKDASLKELKKVAEKCEVCSRPMNDKNPDSKKGVCQDCKEDKESSQDDLLSIKAEAEQLLKDVEGMSKTSYLFIKKGLEKHANDSAFEGNGWCRVWVQEDEIAVDPKYQEALKLPDEGARIVALKEIALNLAHESLRLADSAGAKVGVQSWFESLQPSDHDRIDWVALASPVNEEEEDAKFEQGMADKYGPDAAIPPQAKSSLKSKIEKKAVKVEFVEEEGTQGSLESLTKFLNSKFRNQEQMEMQLESLATEWAMANGYTMSWADSESSDGGALRFTKNSTHVSPDWKPKQASLKLKASDFEKGISQNKTSFLCGHCGLNKSEDGKKPYLNKDVCKDCAAKIWHKDDMGKLPEPENIQNKTADEPTIEPKTQFKDYKITPKYTPKEEAQPVNLELDQVLSKMDALEQNLGALDGAKKEIQAKLQEEMKKIDQAGERVQMEEELQASIEKASVLIQATSSKVVQWRDKLLTVKNEEVQYVPKLTQKELLEKIYAKFEKAEAFVTSVLNGMLSQAKTVTEKTLIRWPNKKSSLNKEASVIDQWNDELLAALKELSSPL